MSKVGLIIRREYVSRVRKKSFIIMTIVGPLLMGGIFASIFMLDKVDSEQKTIVVKDDSFMFADKFKSNDRLKFIYSKDPVDSLRSNSEELGYFGVLHIPAASNLPSLEMQNHCAHYPSLSLSLQNCLCYER